MSMICRVLGLSRAQIGALRAKPSLAGNLTIASRDNQLERRLASVMSKLPPNEQAAAETQIRAAVALAATARAELGPIGPFQPALDLQKSWHLLHFLFTGQVGDSSAPGDALLTGEELGDDLGYGPARLHDAQETQDFARFLAALDVARLQERVNYRELLDADIYGLPMGRDPDAEYERELREEVAVYFPRLQHYVAKTAEQQGGLLIWLS